MNAKENLESFREKAVNAPMFECACCGMAKERKNLGAIRNYEPDSPRLRARMVGPCAYAICEDCKRIPSKEQRVKITQFVAKQGLFKD